MASVPVFLFATASAFNYRQRGKPHHVTVLSKTNCNCCPGFTQPFGKTIFFIAVASHKTSSIIL